MTADLRIRPANEASWDELQLVLTGTAGRCQCTRQRLADREWYALPVEQRAALLREAVGCDDPRTTTTIGLVGWLEEEPVAWVAVDRRAAYARVRNSPVAWTGRHEQKDDPGVWAIACIVVRRGYRHRGLTYPLVAAAVEHARAQGAAAIEGYPMLTGGAEISWDELSVGPVGPFVAAGFAEVSRPTKRRVVMRLELDVAGGVAGAAAPSRP